MGVRLINVAELNIEHLTVRDLVTDASGQVPVRLPPGILVRVFGELSAHEKDAVRAALFDCWRSDVS
jgi:hypothetical protein